MGHRAAPYMAPRGLRYHTQRVSVVVAAPALYCAASGLCHHTRYIVSPTVVSAAAYFRRKGSLTTIPDTQSTTFTTLKKTATTAAVPDHNYLVAARRQSSRSWETTKKRTRKTKQKSANDHLWGKQHITPSPKKKDTLYSLSTSICLYDAWMHGGSETHLLIMERESNFQTNY